MADFMDVRKIRFGASARTSEGERGTVAEVVVTQANGVAQGVGVRFGAFGKPVYTTLDHVIAADDDQIELDVPRSEFVATAPAGARLTSGTAVMLDDKRVGRLGHITFDYVTRKPLRLVVERGAGGPAAITASGLTGITEKGLALSAGKNGATASLAPYHSDSELREDIRQAIENYARLRVDIAGVNIQAVDGAVWLRGFVSSELNNRLVEDIVSGVAGVAELHDELTADPALAATISSALARNPDTAEEHIGVYPTLGRVFLRGVVKSPAAREAASRVAASGHGAREVINELRVDPHATVLPVLAGVTGNEEEVPGGN